MDGTHFFDNLSQNIEGQVEQTKGTRFAGDSFPLFVLVAHETMYGFGCSAVWSSFKRWIVRL